jgi:hypothetical protein
MRIGFRSGFFIIGWFTATGCGLIEATSKTWPRAATASSRHIAVRNSITRKSTPFVAFSLSANRDPLHSLEGLRHRQPPRLRSDRRPCGDHAASNTVVKTALFPIIIEKRRYRKLTGFCQSGSARAMEAERLGSNDLFGTATPGQGSDEEPRRRIRLNDRPSCAMKPVARRNRSLLLWRRNQNLRRQRIDRSPGTS